jgi:excisionase family DNA binding protein
VPSKGTLMANAEPWASVEDVVAHLGVARDSVYRWIERRGLPAHKIGRLWKFKLSEVDAWVRAGGAIDDEVEAPRKSTTIPKQRKG